MSGKCELSGIGPLYGNNVSHSNRKTRRRFEPNIKTVSFKSELLNAEYRFKVTASCARSVEKNGLDVYLCKTPAESLSQKAKSLRKKIKSLSSS